MSNPIPKQQPSQFTALRQVGHIQNVDFVFTTLVVGAILTLAVWPMVGTPTFQQLVGLGFAGIGVVLLWLVCLAFRCSWFVIQVWSSMKLLPEDAARLAIAFQRGGQPHA